MSLRGFSGALLVVAALGFLAIGVPSFLAPAWAAGEFPWAVGPFLAQTIGAWSIGTALIAVHAVWLRDAARSYPLLAYLWLFGIGQALVVFFFLDRLQTGHVLTWPYLIGLGALVGSWVMGVASWMSGRGVSGPGLLVPGVSVPGVSGRRVTGADGASVPTYAKAFGVLVGLFVLLLAIGTLFAGPNGFVATGGIFPEPMGLFSIRAFSAFLFAVAGSIGAVLLARSIEPYIAIGTAGLYLVVTITVVALLNLSLFDFSGRPGGLLYILAYVIVGILLAVTILVFRRRTAP